ncbi:MAG: glycine cleavage system protein R [Beutenbergiaceae bacterium]
MRQLILTAIGRDRAGLVSALAEQVQSHGGTWEFSEMAELAGTFAGVVQVAVPAAQADAFIADLSRLDADLEVRVRPADEPTTTVTSTLHIELIADDRPGLVKEISTTLAHLGVGIGRLETSTRPAPMSGGQLFVLRAVAAVPADVAHAQVRTALENLSNELLVELRVDDEATEPA